MRFEIDWCEEYLEYRRERGLGQVPEGLVGRLESLLREYRSLVDHGQLLEARRLVRWLEPRSSFILRDPEDETRYECLQTRDGEQFRVVSAYAPEEVELQTRQMPEARDEVVALAFPPPTQEPPRDPEPSRE